jgi:hypothetical protein
MGVRCARSGCRGPCVSAGIGRSLIGLSGRSSLALFFNLDRAYPNPGVHGLNERKLVVGLYEERDYLFDLIQAYANSK